MLMGLRGEEGSGMGCFGSGEKPQSEAGSSAAVRALGVRSEQGSQKSSCDAGWQRLCCLSPAPHLILPPAGSSRVVKNLGVKS